MTSTVDAARLQEAIDALRERGITNPESLLLGRTPQAVLDACRKFDLRSGAGTGLLVRMVRDGDRVGPTPASVVAESARYQAGVWEWLAENLPACIEGSLPHPEAVAAVFRLHLLHGKGRLTVREHGPLILAAVKRARERAKEEG